MLKRGLCFAALAALLFSLAVVADGRFAPVRQLPPGVEDADVTELPEDTPISLRELPLGGGTVRVTERAGETRWTREYRDEKNNRFIMIRQLCDGTESPLELCRETLPAGTVLRLYDPAAGDWIAAPLEAGEYAANTVVLEAPSGETRFICLPLTFIEREHTVLEHQPALAGRLRAEAVRDGFVVTVLGFGNRESSFVDCTLVASPKRTLDWNGDNWARMWDRFTNDGESLMCFSGYYRFTPENYVPSGKNCYYNCAAGFLARATRWDFVKSASAGFVTVAILDASMQAQNAYGYFPTAPKSSWLAADYGLGHNFYDTRFNTDFLQILLYTRTNCGMKLFQPQLDRYAAFYFRFAEEHHTETENGGWLVADYWAPEMASEPHTSLNHQLAECELLYRLQDDSGDPRFGELADRLLLAVEDTGADWVKPNHDLHYCRYTDGSYGAQDYPDLTYKDILSLRRYLQKSRSRVCPTLELLLREKGIWMDANGVKR